jgi:hypothetical protein
MKFRMVGKDNHPRLANVSLDIPINTDSWQTADPRTSLDDNVWLLGPGQNGDKFGFYGPLAINKAVEWVDSGKGEYVPDVDDLLKQLFYKSVLRRLQREEEDSDRRYETVKQSIKQVLNPRHKAQTPPRPPLHPCALKLTLSPGQEEPNRICRLFTSVGHAADLTRVVTALPRLMFARPA